MSTPQALALAAVLLASPALAAKPADPAPVIAAERAFSARAGVVGVAPSFLEFMTDEAIVFNPDPVKAKALYGARPAGKTPKEGGPLLAWWPSYAGIARSADLGFTTGPAEVNGKRTVHYFTVWQKQADGSWKWVYDGGAPSDATRAPGPDGPVREMPAGDARAMKPDEALAQVKAAEAEITQAGMKDVAQALAPWIAPDARVQGSPLAPANTTADVAKELAARPQQIHFAPIGGSASKAGDLVWTYGNAHYLTGAGRGHYVRIWQRRGGKWWIVFDQVLDVPRQP
jgi:hypothetical protein